jgi:hypothetical protein
MESLITATFKSVSTVNLPAQNPHVACAKDNLLTQINGSCFFYVNITNYLIVYDLKKDVVSTFRLIGTKQNISLSHC